MIRCLFCVCKTCSVIFEENNRWVGLLLITDINKLLLQSYRCVIRTSDASINKYVANHFAKPSCCSSHAHSLIPVLHFCTNGKSICYLFFFKSLHHEGKLFMWSGAILCVSSDLFVCECVLVRPVCSNLCPPCAKFLFTSVIISTALRSLFISSYFLLSPSLFSRIETLVTDKWKLQLNLIRVVFSSCLRLHLSAENNGGHSPLNACAMHDS